MTLPDVFGDIGERVVASFTFEELGSGTGTIVYQGISHSESGTEGFSLLTPIIESFTVQSIGAATGGSATLILDEDYDLLFNLPQNLNGKGRAIFTFFISTSTGTGNNNTFVIVKLRKFSGAAETDIVSVQTETKNLAPSTIEGFQQVMEFDIPKTHFKKDDIMRITMEVWSQQTGTRPATVGYAHDPKNRNNTSIPDDDLTKQLQIHIPFVIDL